MSKPRVLVVIDEGSCTARIVTDGEVDVFLVDYPSLEGASSEGMEFDLNDSLFNPADENIVSGEEFDKLLSLEREMATEQLDELKKQEKEEGA